MTSAGTATKTSTSTAGACRRLHRSETTSATYHVHINAISDGPGVLEVVLDALAQRVWDLVEANELLDPHDVGVVARRARVEALDDGAHVTEDTRVH